jgi:hypothetical protein
LYSICHKLALIWRCHVFFCFLILVCNWLFIFSSYNWDIGSSCMYSCCTNLVYILAGSVRDCDSGTSSFVMWGKNSFADLYRPYNLCSWLDYLHTFDVLGFLLARAVNDWMVFCTFDASRFTKAYRSFLIIPLTINALRNLTFWMRRFKFYSALEKWTNVVNVLIIAFWF